MLLVSILSLNLSYTRYCNVFEFFLYNIIKDKKVEIIHKRKGIYSSFCKI